MALPRVFISTDLRLSSEETDDAQSLIHALLYQDRMNIAGTASRNGRKKAAWIAEARGCTFVPHAVVAEVAHV